MFCQHCGTRVAGTQQRFCQECGREVGAPVGDQAGAPQGFAGRTWSMPPIQPLRVYAPRVLVRYGVARPLLMLVAALILLPFALALLSVPIILGVVLLHAVFHLLPMLFIGAGIYWFMTRQHRARRSW